MGERRAGAIENQRSLSDADAHRRGRTCGRTLVPGATKEVSRIDARLVRVETIVSEIRNRPILAPG